MTLVHTHDDDGTAEGCPGCFPGEAPEICTCQILDTPGLNEEFGPGVQVQVLTIDPACAVHTGPPNPLCRACTDDDGFCTCTKPCGSITCTGGWT